MTDKTTPKFSQQMAGTILTVFQRLPQSVWRNASGGDLANEITRALQAAGYVDPKDET